MEAENDSDNDTEQLKLPQMAKTQRPYTSEKQPHGRAASYGGHRTMQGFSSGKAPGKTHNVKNMMGMTKTNFGSRNQERNVAENRRKVSEAMNKMMFASAEFKQGSVTSGSGLDSQFNSFLNNSLPADRTVKPRVLALSNRRMRMGDLSAAKTKFQLTAAPRVNVIQAALFTDKNQQIHSPMFHKRLNPAIYNEAAVKMGATYLPDGHHQQQTQQFANSMQSPSSTNGRNFYR